MAIADGGPAFPAYWEGRAAFGEDFCQPGMSLRDWFAGECYIVTLKRGTDGDGAEEDFDGAARDAYKRADAMLKAREKRGS